MDTDISPVSLRWLDTWRMAFLHPTIKTFSRIMNDPKVSLRWGLIWMAIAACLAWLLGPLRPVIWGWVMTNFGMQSPWPVTATGAVVVPLWGVISLLFGAALAHGLAHLSHGQGTFRQLVYCWGVLQLPFVLIAILVLNVPWIFHISPGTTVSTSAIAFTIAKLVAAAVVIIYLAYAQVVAFGAVEGFSVWKGFGVLVLLSFVLGMVGTCLSTWTRALLATAY